MIKKLLLSALCILSLSTLATAQNIQMHYDFGRSLYSNDLKGRPLWTSTVEDFVPDKWGSTYFFFDMDYNNGGVNSAYWEISRELKFWKAPFSFHVEYNGGNFRGEKDPTKASYNFYNVNNAYLLGGTYTYNDKTFSKGFSFSAMYKYIQHLNHPHNFQFTITWYYHIADNLITLDGFADFWREENMHGKTIFISEPQIWLNLNKIKGVDKDFNLSIGSETELSNNFSGRDGFYAIPTAAIKWTFK
jgi:uncharacterized protein Usg